MNHQSLNISRATTENIIYGTLPPPPTTTENLVYEPLPPSPTTTETDMTDNACYGQAPI